MISAKIASQDSKTLQAMMDHIEELNDDEVHIAKILAEVNPDRSVVDQLYWGMWNKRLMSVRAWKADNKRFIADLLKLMEFKDK